MVGLREALARRERLLPAASPLFTLPTVLIALLRFSEFGVHLFKARDGSSTWYFRFSPKAVLEVRDDGDWCWRQGTARWRREIAPFLARAQALLAQGGVDGGLAAEAPERRCERAVARAALRSKKAHAGSV